MRDLLWIWLANELELLVSASHEFLRDGGPAVWEMLERNAELLPDDGLDELRHRIDRVRTGQR